MNNVRDFYDYEHRRKQIEERYRVVTEADNEPVPPLRGVFTRFTRPVLTWEHVPPTWRFDYDRDENPLFLERLGVNAAFNVGAVEIDGVVRLVARVEGADRKSFFAVAESSSGVGGFTFTSLLDVPPHGDETNLYDMRLTKHEDGFIYGVFCTESHDPAQPNDPTAAIAQCGVIRSKDMQSWERLPNLETSAPQQRNCVLHPTFVNGKYAFYTRPQDEFISAGSGGGIGFGLVADMNDPVVTEQRVVDPRGYHTIKEAKNGQGAPPIKTEAGWLHIAHGVRNTAAGLRYVLYAFLTAIDEPWRVTHRPGGYILAPEGEERVGDVSNVAFANGMVLRDDGLLYLYYGSSDTRTHVAVAPIEAVVDYVVNTPPDGETTHGAVAQRQSLIDRNGQIMKE